MCTIRLRMRALGGALTNTTVATKGWRTYHYISLSTRIKWKFQISNFKIEYKVKIQVRNINRKSFSVLLHPGFEIVLIHKSIGLALWLLGQICVAVFLIEELELYWLVHHASTQSSHCSRALVSVEHGCGDTRCRYFLPDMSENQVWYFELCPVAIPYFEGVRCALVGHVQMA